MTAERATESTAAGRPAEGALSRRVVVDLSGPGARPWSFRVVPDAAIPGHADLDRWLPATVPGTVHTDLLANGKIANPFYGQNEKEQQWIDERAWEYRTTISADDALLAHAARGSIDLVWKGLDTYADVSLNGEPILSADNMFREWRVPVGKLLRRGDNALLVRFRSPIAAVNDAYDRLGYTLPAVNDQATRMVSMFTRKAPYQYGWDWGPRFVTSGVWRPVFLEAWDVARLDDVQVVQTSLTDAAARLHLKATVVAARPGRAQVTFAIAGGATLGQVEATLAAGTNVVEADVTIEHPIRWWPHGLGEPHLYTIATALAVDGAALDARSTRVGLRTVEVVSAPDKLGKSFTIRVNGAPVFMKGANYVPPDSFLPRVTPERTRWLLTSAVDANMNMLRVWGGGVYEDDRFYDLADELGLLVWQDFMFACSMYPGDAAFVENVRQEAIQNVRRLRNHPSVALWAGNNEIESAWTQWGWQRKFGLSEAAQATIGADYKHLFHEVLPRVVADEDPGRFYTRSSPSANDDRIDVNTLGYGDMHYWGVWHAEEPYQRYSDNVSRFMSEYGFQSFPELATVARYAPPDEHRIDSPVMLAHQRHPRGNQLVREYMDRDFRTPKDFASFLYVSQVLQATVVGYAAEAHRRRMPYNQGSLYWQLDDCWPVASWSGIDYFGRWKALHYYARRFFAPVLASVVADERTLQVYVVSDRRQDAAARLSLRLVDLDGRELWRKDEDVTIAANTSHVAFEAPIHDVLHGADTTRVVFSAEIVERGDGPERTLSRGLHYFVKTKDLALSDPGLDVAVATAADSTTSVRVGARKLARAVHLSADVADGTFSDDYFDVLPGETVTVTWRGPHPGRISATSIVDTY